MKHIIVRIAVLGLFAAGSLSAFSAEPQQGPKQPDTSSPIPVCYQCGHPPSGN